MPYTINIEILDDSQTPLALASTSINNGAPSIGSSYILNITSEGAIKIEITLDGYYPYNQVLYFPEEALEGSLDFKIYLYQEFTRCNSELVPFNYIIEKCTNRLYVYNNVSIPSDVNWNFGDGNTGSGQQSVNEYYYPSTYSVQKTLIICEPGEIVEGCCGGSTVTQNCTNYDCEPIQIEITEFKPRVLVIANCSQGSTKDQTSQKDCIQGCYGCGCDDAAFCRCVLKNQPVNVKFIPFPNFNHCQDEQSALLQVYSNDELILQQTINNYEPVETTMIFNQDGRYVIKAVLTNCCGSCEFEKEIIVGGYVKLERLACHTYKFTDYTTDTSNKINIKIKNINGEVVKEYLFLGDKLPTLNFTTDEDGIYIVEYNITSYTGVILKSKSFLLYDFCTIVECYTKMVTHRICVVEKCENKEEFNEFLNKLNSFVVLATAFVASMDIQYGTSYGYMYYDEKYLGVLKYHEVILKALLKLCNGCSKTLNDCGCGNN